MVGATEHPGELADIAGPDIAAPRSQRHHEGEIPCWDPLGQQADLRVPKQQRRQHPVGKHRAARHCRSRRGTRSRSQRPAHRSAHQRAQRHLLRAQPERAGDRPGRRSHRDGPGAGEALGRPPQRGSQRGAGRDALPQRRNLARPLPRPGHRLRSPQSDRASDRPDGASPRAPVTGECGAGQATDRAGEANGLRPARRGRAISCHPRNLPVPGRGSHHGSLLGPFSLPAACSTRTRSCVWCWTSPADLLASIKDVAWSERTHRLHRWLSASCRPCELQQVAHQELPGCWGDGGCWLECAGLGVQVGGVVGVQQAKEGLGDDAAAR
jgi:hypothetical protein